MVRLRRSLFAVLFALACSVAPFVPTRAQSSQQPGPQLLSFTLGKTEVARGEPVEAFWMLDRPAKNIRLAAGTVDGVLFSYQLPISLTTDPRGTVGTITFTIPAEAATLSPILLMLKVDGQFLGSNTLRVKCDWPWFFQPRAERCPSQPIKPQQAAMQRFEGGRMFWLKDRDSILVFYNDKDDPGEGARWEIFEDRFNEGDAEFDPTLAPPTGKFQPVRGFGLVWRTQPRVREKLGWALEKERGYTACVGAGFGGWRSMKWYLNDADNRLYEMDSYYAPTRWRPMDKMDGLLVQVKCG